MPAFFDEKLMKNGSRACGNCGKAEGFSKRPRESALFADFSGRVSFHMLQIPFSC